jgi:hypothetical protein
MAAQYWHKIVVLLIYVTSTPEGTGYSQLSYYFSLCLPVAPADKADSWDK